MEEDNDSDNGEVMDDSDQSDEDYIDTVPSTSHNLVGSIQQNLDKDLLKPKQKRKRKEGRRRIRKILSQGQLDLETVSAQKEEQERLRRLELQKSLNTVPLTVQTTPPLDKSSPNLEFSNTPEQPVLVDVSRNKAPDRIIVIDDSDDDCGIVENSLSVSGCVIEISDSETEMSCEEDEADEEPENSGSHTNDDVNLPDCQGRVLVNVNHPPTEPDIFVASHLSSLVKPHQIGGIRFLYDNLVESLSRYQVSPGFGCILAHSMGLGKTLQVICFIDVFLRFTKATKVLCIVPMNTIQNWYSEFNAWLPEASSGQSGGERSAEEGLQQEKQGRTFQVMLFSENVRTTVARSALIAKWEKQGGVLLMGYEMYRILAMYTPSLVNNTKLTGSKRKRPNTATTEVIDLDEEEKNMDLLLEIQKSVCKPGPDLVVCDEGHRIKNNQANISQALKKIHTRRRVVLTGYPLQNNLLEYWCMVDFVRPNFLGTKHEFSNMFERPITNGQCVDSTAFDTKLMRFRAHVLHSLLEGFVQRRSEAVLTKTLPEKEEYVIPVKMTPIQMSLYKSFVTSVKNYVGYINPIKAFGICIKIWNHPDILKSYLDSKKDASRNNSPLTVCDPDLDIGETVGKKTKDPKSYDSKLPSSSSEPSVALPELKAITNAGDWVGDLMDNYKAGVLQHGAKMVLLTEIIEKSVQMGDKILVFSQSLSTLSIIEEFLRKRVVPPLPSQLIFQPVHWERNKNYYRLDGGTSSQEREKLIRAFNAKTNHSVFLFLLSTRACSLGVNLIGANRVVIFDASWNPCHDAQAVCRIYRYGQTKKCFIYRLVSHGTFEKRMYERQVTKEGMSDRVIDELNPEANLTKLEVMHLFKEVESDGEEDVLNIQADVFPDPVLNHLCGTCQKSILEIPFKHKLQSSHKSKNILTKAEKREAKKGYEREKRAINSANKQSISSTISSPLAREQLRKEVTNRPVGHVKPIQNVQANSNAFIRPPLMSLPAPLQASANPFSGSTLPSMAYMAGLTFPPLLNNRFYQMGELRPLSPYPGNFSMPYPVPGMNLGIEQTNLRQPIIVDLLTSPEEKQNLGDASKIEDVSRAVETGNGDDLIDAKGTGKVYSSEVLVPPPLCDISNGFARVPGGASQNTAGATQPTQEQAVVAGSRKEEKLREMSIVSEASPHQLVPVTLNSITCEGHNTSSIVTTAPLISGALSSPGNCKDDFLGVPSVTVLSKEALDAIQLGFQPENITKSISKTDKQCAIVETAVGSKNGTGPSSPASPSGKSLVPTTSNSSTVSAVDSSL